MLMLMLGVRGQEFVGIQESASVLERAQGESVARIYMSSLTNIEELHKCFKKNITHAPEYVCTGYSYYISVERDARC
jgi:hypothetical protein